MNRCNYIDVLYIKKQKNIPPIYLLVLYLRFIKAKPLLWELLLKTEIAKIFGREALTF